MQSTTEIFNRPPSIAEDALHYALYPQDASSDKTNVSALALAIQAYLDETLRGFIWHRDSFELKLLQDEDTKLYYIGGDMRVGDSIDDEWCAVWLLKEISARWDVAVSVYDSDGDFLLIEAADVLPPWVTPSVSENRVWIHAAQLHLIPLQHVSPSHTVRRKRRIYAEDDELAGVDVGTNPEAAGEWLAVHDALKLVRDGSVATRASKAVEETVWKRISGYPAALASHMHTTKAYIPMDVAKALASNPDLVQKAIETFYTRDPAQLRAAHKMSRFPPSQSVLRRVRMTRTAYAQLLGQKFYPPKIFGTFREPEGSPTWRWRDVGMKIACGFEMLYQESKSRSESTADALRLAVDARKDALRRDNEYIAYIKTLLSAGYFGGELEGSAKWSELEDKAADVFVRTRQQDSTSTRPSFAAQVNTSISSAPSSLTDELEAPEDPDDWLNVDATDFDSFLAEKMNLSTSTKSQPTDAMDVDKKEDDGEMSDGEVKAAEDMLAKEQAARLTDLAKKVEKFLGAKGDVEGARFEDEKSDDDDALSEFSDEQFSDSDSEEEGATEEVETEESRAARREAMDKLVPALSAGEYGQMPASYHANSQRVTRATVNTDTIGGLPTSTSTSPSTATTRPVRGPILMRDRYEGVDSDDETDEEEEDEAGAESDEENQPQVVGDVEVDMGEEEDDFLEFSRQALGIDDQQWKDIISERKARGAFVPTHVVTDSKAKTSGGKKDAKEPQLRTPAPGPRPNANPNLDSFEAVMQAMETELARSRAAKEPFKAPNPNPKPASSSNPAPPDAKGKGKAVAEDDDMDIEAAMEEELRAALGKEDDLDDDVEVDEDGLPINGEGGLDYNLIKNFLESFKSQGGLAGPVSSLAGRLQPGWNMPRDDA
ncbi:SGT1-domain-containing protein [Peniophora sp. CONT]|nr:SGT1-domain-containing protein [Peniophora sp. CONT]